MTRYNDWLFEHVSRSPLSFCIVTSIALLRLEICYAHCREGYWQTYNNFHASQNTEKTRSMHNFLVLAIYIPSKGREASLPASSAPI